MREALQGDCTRYAPGVGIISVRVTKPTILDTIKQNYEQMSEERTKVNCTIAEGVISLICDILKKNGFNPSPPLSWAPVQVGSSFIR